MEVKAVIATYCIVPDPSPFVIYGLNVTTTFSRQVVIKRYTDFYNFHKQLCYFAFEPIDDDQVLLDLLPPLPDSLRPAPLDILAILQRKDRLNAYLEQVVGILASPLFNKFQPWCRLIYDFLTLDAIHKKEEACAYRLQQQFRIYKSRLQLRTTLHQNYVKNGYVSNIDQMPDCVLLESFGFLKLEQLCSIARVCKRWCELIWKPFLWKTLNLFQKPIALRYEAFEEICMRAWQLTCIDLRYCQYITSQSLLAIAHYCNPISLKELLLDGCEYVDDHAIICLTEKFNHIDPKLTRERDRYSLNQVARSRVLDTHGFKGGARGLVKLSVAECRQVTDQGLKFIGKLKLLKELNLLGCYTVTDEGLRSIVLRTTGIERLNVSGTCVTRDGLRLLGDRLPNLIEVTATCCRLLLPTDKQILPNVKLDINEDIFRFQLETTPGSKLPNITSNVLRTRSSLSILRVNSYICRRLERDDIEIDIVFKDQVLTPYQTLQEISDKNSGLMLSLQYRLKEETKFVEQIKKYQGRLVTLPVWVADDASSDCQECSKAFGIVQRRHHCRKCGRLLCAQCTDHFGFLPEFGYTKNKVRICLACRQVNAK